MSDCSFVGTSYIDIPHNIGYYPDYVVVQLKMPDNYISEAQGSNHTILYSLSLSLSFSLSLMIYIQKSNPISRYSV